jgi:uncharacterized protein involved in type VI secretion and phage assembly
MRMIPGATFEVEGHRMPELDSEYAVVTAEHTIAPRDGVGSHGVYHNKLSCARSASRWVASLLTYYVAVPLT